MKTITNKDLEIKMSTETGEVKQMTRLGIIKLVVNSPGREGTSITEMRSAIKIIEKVEKSENTLELEDAEFTFLKQKFDVFKWAMSHKDIVDLYDHLDEVSKQK